MAISGTRGGDGGCACCRRAFLGSLGTAAGAALLGRLACGAGERLRPSRARAAARVRALFLYPASRGFASDPDGWWSWPGNEFDAEGRQAAYTVALMERARRCGVELAVAPDPVFGAVAVEAAAQRLEQERPDAVLLLMFYNNSLQDADRLLAAAEKVGLPAIFYIPLGAKHGPVTQYRRPGVYFIQALEDHAAIEYGLRMVAARTRVRQARLLSITEAPAPSETVEPFLGVTVRVIPFARYAELFAAAPVDAAARELIGSFTSGAREVREVTVEALENAARAHLALEALLREEEADGLAMNCLRRGMLKPCMSFAAFNGQLVPAACENDLPALYTQLFGQLLLGRPGFQHNPCYDTERNHYYASHCTCAPRLDGPDRAPRPYLLRRFAHSNEGSCAIQVFWNPGDPVTVARYYPGADPALDVYAGTVAESYPMPPAGGCTTTVAIALAGGADATVVKGHHNLLFCGDVARQLRLFAQLYRMRVTGTAASGA